MPPTNGLMVLLMPLNGTVLLRPPKKGEPPKPKLPPKPKALFKPENGTLPKGETLQFAN